MKAVFITGTDTGTGKTIVSGLLAKFLLQRNNKVITQKWLQTGDKKKSQDVRTHLRLMNISEEELAGYAPLMTSYVFEFPSSPHLAARQEKRNISINKIKRDFRFLAERFDYVIVEGKGGALVPVNKKKMVVDIAKELNLPVIIVAANKLGAINHTLLTIEAIKKRKMRLIGVLFNNTSGNVDRKILEDNPEIIKIFSKDRALGILPWIENKDMLYRKFVPIGEKISSYLWEINPRPLGRG